MNTVQFQVEGMSCQGCASSIEKALAKMPNVEKASVDFPKKSLTVEGKIQPAEVASVLDGLGFEARAVSR